ncbi:uncharacterized [Lates japonicus]
MQSYCSYKVSALTRGLKVSACLHSTGRIEDPLPPAPPNHQVRRCLSCSVVKAVSKPLSHNQDNCDP